MASNKWTRRSLIEGAVFSAAGLSIASGVPATDTPPAVIPTKLGPGEKLRIGIIGCGARSPFHIAAVNHYEQIEVGALCDIIPDKLEEKKELIRNGQPLLYTDYTRMLKQDDLHAVVIVLPNTLHRKAAVASLDAGKHVLCEKPLTLDVAGCKDIIQAADRNRKVLQVGTQSRHSPDYQELAGRIHQGLVGQVLYAWINTFRVDWRKLHPDPEIDAKINWRMKQAEGGAVIYEQGIHTIDVFNWFINSPPEEITCLGGVHNKRLEKRDSWDHAGVVVRFANGALATYGGNLYSCGGRGSDVLFGDESTLQVERRGASQARLHSRTYWRPYGMEQDPRSVSKELPLPPVDTDPSTLQYGHFLEAVQGNKPPFPSARDHLPAIQIARGALMSMAERRHIKAFEVS